MDDIPAHIIHLRGKWSSKYFHVVDVSCTLLDTHLLSAVHLVVLSFLYVVVHMLLIFYCVLQQALQIA